MTLRAYMGSHASVAQVVPYVTNKPTILSGVPCVEQTLRLSKNRQVCSRRGQAFRRAYTSAMAGWPLLGLGRHCGRHVGIFLCRCQRPGHRQRCSGGAEGKVSKYAGLQASHLFVSIAIETLGPINEAEHSFLFELGRRLSTISDDPRESFLLFQRISILIQRFNEFAFRGTFDAGTVHDE